MNLFRYHGASFKPNPKYKIKSCWLKTNTQKQKLNWVNELISKDRINTDIRHLGDRFTKSFCTVFNGAHKSIKVLNLIY